MSNPQTPADAVPHSWVDSMPQLVQPYLRLARLDRPVGTWLLFWPCVWSLVLAQGQEPDWSQLAWFILLMFVGSLVMRGAGCAYNDIVDRDMDAQVARTRGRPLPAGLISVRQAWMFLLLLALMGLVVLLQFNLPAIVTGLASLLLVAAYPFMKRVTWWPQAWLGLTFNWGALVGWVAVTGKMEAPAVLLYAAGFFWTLGYDTIYALQDVEDDALAGVKSSARALGKNAARGVSIFYVLSSLCLMLALYVATSRLLMTLLVIPVVVHFLLQVKKLRPDNPQVCLQLFKSNRDAGLLMALACLGALII
jgi:4-hydroxybenzoate polyprenyltransferase